MQAVSSTPGMGDGSLRTPCLGSRYARGLGPVMGVPGVTHTETRTPVTRLWPTHQGTCPRPGGAWTFAHLGVVTCGARLKVGGKMQ